MIEQSRVAEQSVETVMGHRPIGQAEAALLELGLGRPEIAIARPAVSVLAQQREVGIEPELDLVRREVLEALAGAGLAPDLIARGRLEAGGTDVRETGRHRVPPDRAGVRFDFGVLGREEELEALGRVPVALHPDQGEGSISVVGVLDLVFRVDLAGSPEGRLAPHDRRGGPDGLVLLLALRDIGALASATQDQSGLDRFSQSPVGRSRLKAQRRQDLIIKADRRLIIRRPSHRFLMFEARGQLFGKFPAQPPRGIGRTSRGARRGVGEVPAVIFAREAPPLLVVVPLDSPEARFGRPGGPRLEILPVVARRDPVLAREPQPQMGAGLPRSLLDEIAAG